jgi:D-lactate dehydrogenase
MEQLVATITPATRLEASDAVGDAESIGSALRRILDRGRVLDRPIDRIAFSSDASFYRLVPQAVVQPATLGEIARLFAFSRTRSIPLVFRAGGTSLSGQSITDGILVDVARYWRSAEIEDEGRVIRVQPGVIGKHANDLLKAHGAKIGPDPASISVARLGGILSNNASGMCCGVSQNAYHTLASMKFMLPSGTVIDTALHDADARFRHLEPELCTTLLRLKERVETSPYLAGRIRAKYRTKNTTGYSLNAFIDFETPSQIFSHLMIGAEGTLGFIAQAVMKTVPDLPIKYTGLLIFSDLHRACEAILPLREAGAAALELMDRASLHSVEQNRACPESFPICPSRQRPCWLNFKRKMRAMIGGTGRRRNRLPPALNCFARRCSLAMPTHRHSSGACAKVFSLRWARCGTRELLSLSKTSRFRSSDLRMHPAI